MAAGVPGRAFDRSVPLLGARATRPVSDTAARRIDVGSPLVLDLVIVLGVLALFALVGAVLAGVGTL